jgi:ribulose-bisphosphate carboxylase small chain
MQQPKRFPAAGTGTDGERIFGQIEKCLRQGCVIRIEHTPAMAPRFTPWREWGQSSCYDGNPQQVFHAIDCCRASYSDHYIRLVLEDFSCHSRFSFVVHSPLRAAA